MKKFKLGILALLISCSAAFGQKVIENPVYAGRNSPTIDIVKIELRDTATAFYCNATFIPKWWIQVPGGTYIQPAEGGEKLEITAAEGITIGEKFWMPESGKSSFVLYFPPLDPSTSTIDFIECPEPNCFNFYDIQLQSQQQAKVVPVFLEGEWFSASDQGSWAFGFYDDFAVYNNDFWNYGPIRSKGKITEVTLVKGTQSKTLYTKAGKEGEFLIGLDKKHLLPYSKDRLIGASLSSSTGPAFSVPDFKQKETVIKGYIKGYSPKMNTEGGKVMVESVFSREEANRPFEIDKYGRFEVKIPMEYPANVHLSLLRARPSFFVEPGSEILVVIELDEFTTTYRTREKFSNREKKSLFMGDCAPVNAELQQFGDLVELDEEKIMKDVLLLNPEQYKEAVAAQLEEKLSLLGEYKKENRMSLKTAQYLDAAVKLEALTMLLDYNMKRRSALYRAEKDKPDSLRTPYEMVALDKEYYSFIRDMEVDYSIGLGTNSFQSFISRVRYFNGGKEKSTTDYLNQMEKLLKEKGISLTAEELEVKGAVASLENKSEIDRKAVMDKYSNLLKSLNEKYSSLIGSSMMDYQDEEGLNNVKEYLGMEEGLVLDIIRAQNKVRIIDHFYVAMSEEELQDFDSKVSTPFVKEFIHTYNEEVKKELATEKDMKGVVVNETPEAEAEKLFEAIIKKYEGKVVYIDFWATWCGPCMGEMPHSKVLKKDLEGKEVVFLYLTNESSPLKTWSNKISEMEGEHYRLKREDWENLTNKFNVRGIPRYMLVDKKGQVVADNATRPSQKDKIKAEISDLLDN